MSLQNKSTIILTLLAILAVVGGGWYWYEQKARQEMPPSPTTLNGQQEEVNKSEDNETTMADWKTYRNEKYGFEFKYPKDWNLNDQKLNNTIVSVSNYFTNKFGNQDGSSVKIKIEENTYDSFEKWLEKNFELFKDESVDENRNFKLQGLDANLVKSTNPIAGGHNDRLAIYDNQKKLVYSVEMYRRIRAELEAENEKYKKVIEQVVNSLKIK